MPVRPTYFVIVGKVSAVLVVGVGYVSWFFVLWFSSHLSELSRSSPPLCEVARRLNMITIWLTGPLQNHKFIN